ncbi:DnaJ sub A member 3, mitochondrial [Entophlyctis luteolus]|nr:DnaJ sub A member 3, mitochondrial [Entophlyctis luteolus]
MFRLRQLGIRTGARTTPAAVYESLLFSCTKRFASQAHPDASETFYDLLAVPQSASQQTIKSQFYALSMKLHPDKVKLRGDQDAIDAATQRFVKINEAYSVLSDEVKRKEYDRVLAHTPRFIQTIGFCTETLVTNLRTTSTTLMHIAKHIILSNHIQHPEQVEEL